MEKAAAGPDTGRILPRAPSLAGPSKLTSRTSASHAGHPAGSAQRENTDCGLCAVKVECESTSFMVNSMRAYNAFHKSDPTATKGAQTVQKFCTVWSRPDIFGGKRIKLSKAGDAPFPFTAEAIARARALNGVTGAGVIYAPTTDDQVASAHPEHTTPTTLPIIAVSPTAWDAIGPALSAGRLYDAFAEHQPVVVLGRAAAGRLGVTGEGPPTAIQIGGRPFLVAGVIDDVERRPDLLLAVLVPTGTAEDLWGAPTPKSEAELLISTHPGAALQVADEAPITVAYLAPRDVSVAPPPDPRALRDHISSDLTSLFYALAGICLLIGTVGIANTTLVAVMERSAEIGLRRALGATGRHIAAHVVAESASLGILGGVLGTALGLTAVIAIALLRGWSPVIEPALLLWAPLLGLATGAAAGLYPARKATRIEPTEALRGR